MSYGRGLALGPALGLNDDGVGAHGSLVVDGPARSAVGAPVPSSFVYFQSPSPQVACPAPKGDVVDSDYDSVGNDYLLLHLNIVWWVGNYNTYGRKILIMSIVLLILFPV